MAVILTVVVVLLVLGAFALAISANRRRDDQAGHQQVTDTSVRPPRGGASPTRGGRPIPGSRAARRRQGKP